MRRRSNVYENCKCLVPSTAPCIQATEIPSEYSPRKTDRNITHLETDSLEVQGSDTIGDDY